MFNNTVWSKEAQIFKEIFICRSIYYVNNPGIVPNSEEYHFEVKLLVGLGVTTLFVKDPRQVTLVLPAVEKFISSIDSLENFHQAEDLSNCASSIAIIVEKAIQKMGYNAEKLPHYGLFSKTLKNICENAAVIRIGKEKEARELLRSWLP